MNTAGRDLTRTGLCGNGTIPITFKGNNYNIPIQFVYKDGFPHVAPFIKLNPTDNMKVTPTNFVAPDGEIIGLPYL